MLYEEDLMLSLLFSIQQSQVKRFLSCVSPCAEEALSMFGRTSQIRTGDLYHVKACHLFRREQSVVVTFQ